MKQSVEFSFQGEDMSYGDMAQVWKAIENAGKDCTITIGQTQPYNDGPYSSPTTTTITVEAK